jgi:hypothetical protein
MDTPEGNSRRAWSGPQRGPDPSGPRGTAGGTRATVLGSLTIPGRPEQVAAARAFVSRTLSVHRVVADADAATLLTSEIVIIRVPHGLLVEVIDGGSAGSPVVKGDLYAADGHGLFLVQHLAAQWGYLRDPAGTTVWFHLPAADRPLRVSEPADPRSASQASRQPGRPDGRTAQLWAATIRSATA